MYIQYFDLRNFPVYEIIGIVKFLKYACQPLMAI